MGDSANPFIVYLSVNGFGVLFCFLLHCLPAHQA